MGKTGDWKANIKVSVKYEKCLGGVIRVIGFDAESLKFIHATTKNLSVNPVLIIWIREGYKEGIEKREWGPTFPMLSLRYCGFLTTITSVATRH